MHPSFRLKSAYSLQGDQPGALNALVNHLKQNVKKQTLLGITGSGKTYTMANVISTLNRPALIISPNKTLAGQLYHEFKELFPDNAVEYFVSYYDYYQPEAYVPSTDTFIEKDSSINDRIDRLRHSATVSLLERRDVIVIASVSCIYGLGSPEIYKGLSIPLNVGQVMNREKFLHQLIDIQFVRNDVELARGSFRVRGNRIEILNASSNDQCLRVYFERDTISKLARCDNLTGEILELHDTMHIFPANHYATPKHIVDEATIKINQELNSRIKYLESENKLLEAQRLLQRTRQDIEMLKETGFCSGIENYSRYLDGRESGEPPNVLLDFFPDDFILFIDESHITVPQIRGMYNGDRARKTVLVDYGFRLPSALDNRPLNFEEFLAKTNQTIYVSATPGDYELEQSGNYVVEQILRPTGLMDPPVSVKPTDNQIHDLLNEIKLRISVKERTLVTTLTKKMAERLSEHYLDQGIKCTYLHSDIDTLERMVIINDLRKGKFDVLIGINLLREGLDLPEVSLVAILEADQEGFLRSHRSLIQIFGRAARNLNGQVIMYADKITPSMNKAMEETLRRRQLQLKYNQENGIVPQSVVKQINDSFLAVCEKDYLEFSTEQIPSLRKSKHVSKASVEKEIESLKKKMKKAASKFEFEEAAALRDQMYTCMQLLNQYA